MAELSLLDTLDAETRAELDGIEKGTPDLERQLRAAATAADAEDRASVIDTGAASGTDTDRLELRSRASIGRFLLGAASGKLSGAERELQAEMNLDPNMIPLEMFDAATRGPSRRPGDAGDHPGTGHRRRNQSRPAAADDLRAVDRGPAHDRNADGRKRHIRKRHDHDRRHRRRREEGRRGARNGRGVHDRDHDPASGRRVAEPRR